MQNSTSTQRVAVYVDMANITRNGGYGMRFDILREFACRGTSEPIRLNIYVAYDEERAKTDRDYKDRTFNFYSTLRDFGYKVIEKKVSWYTDEAGNKFGKANADLDMAVDALLQSEKIDRVVMVTGDGDFVQVINALQNKGLRVEAVAFDNVSSLLKREADLYMPGYLIPDMLPLEQKNNDLQWGDVNSRVRGICYSYINGKKYGFMRFLKRISTGLWITDTRRDDSPYGTAFVHESNLEPIVKIDNLPSRDLIFEFDIIKSDKGLQAVNVELMG